MKSSNKVSLLLPGNRYLPVNLLAACFNNTVATYKFYWLLSIIHSVEKGKTLISKKELFAGMISKAWYTVNYFHISFGQQDKLQRAIERIKVIEGLTVDANQDIVFEKLMQSSQRETITTLNHFDAQVPHWFLSPWFPGSQKSDIYRHSQNLENNCIYSVYPELIQINLAWVNYLIENAALLKDFCYWNLAIFLQKKNPNVPDILNKIIKPAIRSSLTKQRTGFWNFVFEELGSMKCVYTNETLIKENYAMEHFIPYNFVSHNLIWNLLPADKSFNCSKSDKLPIMARHFNKFYDLQKTAIKIIREKQPRNKFLEEYLTIFPDLDKLDLLSDSFTKERFRERIQPLISIASNNGFEFLK